MDIGAAAMAYPDVTISSRREQSAIAAILSDVDAEITTLEANLAKARQLKQGVMQELLTGRTRSACRAMGLHGLPRSHDGSNKSKECS